MPPLALIFVVLYGTVAPQLKNMGVEVLPPPAPCAQARLSSTWRGSMCLLSGGVQGVLTSLPPSYPSTDWGGQRFPSHSK
jgi:hypothetical protein